METIQHITIQIQIIQIIQRQGEASAHVTATVVAAAAAHAQCIIQWRGKGSREMEEDLYHCGLAETTELQMQFPKIPFTLTFHLLQPFVLSPQDDNRVPRPRLHA